MYMEIINRVNISYYLTYHIFNNSKHRAAVKLI